MQTDATSFNDYSTEPIEQVDKKPLTSEPESITNRHHPLADYSDRPADVPFMAWVNGLLEQKLSLSTELRSHFNKAARSWDRLRVRRGRRYEGCRFSNYNQTNELQMRLVADLRSYAINGERGFVDGRNVILFGPKGTGKDHLLMALAYEFINWCGRRVTWFNGLDLMDDFQLIALDKAPKHCGHKDDRPDKCDVLWISDPLPPSGALSDFQQRALIQLIERRYNDLRPTWLSINVASAAEAESRMGAQVVDRLRHEALRHFCNWPSYRSARPVDKT